MHQMVKVSYKEYYNNNIGGMLQVKYFHYYKCVVCNSYFESGYEGGAVYGYHKYNSYEKLTCDEVIIKQIIE